MSKATTVDEPRMVPVPNPSYNARKLDRIKQARDAAADKAGEVERSRIRQDEASRIRELTKKRALLADRAGKFAQIGRNLQSALESLDERIEAAVQRSLARPYGESMQALTLLCTEKAFAPARIASCERVLVEVEAQITEIDEQIAALQ